MFEHDRVNQLRQNRFDLLVRFAASCLSICVLFYSTRSYAVTGSLENEVGKSFRTSTLTVSDSYGQSKESGFLFSKWDFFAGATDSSVEDPSAASSTTQKTRDFGLGIGFSSFSQWDYDLSLHSSRTPETKYSESGGLIGISFKFNLGADSADSVKLNEKKSILDEFLSEPDFRPKVKVGLKLGSTSIRQDFTITILNRSFDREGKLEQKSLGAFVQIDPWEWLSMRLTGTSFSYSRSKEDLQAAYNSAALNFLAEGAVNTIGGLPASNGSLRFLFFLGEQFDIELNGTKTKYLVSSDESNTGLILVSWHGQRLGAGIGAKSTKSTGVPASGSGLLNLDVSF